MPIAAGFTSASVRDDGVNIFYLREAPLLFLSTAMMSLRVGLHTSVHEMDCVLTSNLQNYSTNLRYDSNEAIRLGTMHFKQVPPCVPKLCMMLRPLNTSKNHRGLQFICTRISVANMRKNSSLYELKEKVYGLRLKKGPINTSDVYRPTNAFTNSHRLYHLFLFSGRKKSLTFSSR